MSDGIKISLPYNFEPTTRPFQTKIWNDKRPNKLLVIPRRHGKTSLALNWLILQAICSPGKVYWYLCPNQKQAKEVVWKAPDMINKYLPPEAVDKRNEVELTIYLKNRSQICIKGADDPDTLRGTNPFGIVIDEYAQIKPEVYDEILMPIIKANGGWVWMIGTPKGKNHFWLRYQQAQHLPTWQVVHLKASQSGVLSPEILAEAKKDMTEKSFNQEFECEFLEGAGNIFRRINENATVKPSEALDDGEYQIGVDLARHQDFTVISVVNTKTHKQVYIDRFNQIDWNLQISRIEAIARRYNNAHINIDSTGVGDPICLELKNKGLDVEAFVFTNQVKNALIQNLALLLEQDKLKIIPDEEQIKELQNYTFETTSHGNIRYGAPQGQHDDTVVALALACYRLPEKQLVTRMPLEDDTPFMRFSDFGEPVY
jgi:phage terminase large subunit-like protein